MKIFNLPDLGEGLADAEIREWHVQVGDVVKVDQPLVCMETAKAVVEVPAPEAGTIAKLYGNVGDIINTGAPLVEFGEVRKDGGSVVGSLEESSQRLEEGEMIIGSAKQKAASIKAMPAVRALAQQLNVDLQAVTPTGAQNQITAEDVKKFAVEQGGTLAASHQEALHGVRRAMATAMTQSHQEIVPVTIIQDADIGDLPVDSDITICLLQAMIAGVRAEPALNVWFNSKTRERQLFTEINLGLAMDTSEGLFVPVLKNIASKSAKELRTEIEAYKTAVKSRTFAPAALQGATITLSNFGMIAGRYATPIILPPMVAILGCGQIHDAVLACNGKMEIRRTAPLSLTFDHRVVTGGEATRFLAAVIQTLAGMHS